MDACQWALRAVELGAGELLVTAIDREGTGKGYDLELTRKIAELVPVPVIAGGGPGRIEDVYEAIVVGKADAVSIASLLHYDFVRHNRSHDRQFVEEGNTEFLRKGSGFSKIEGAGIPQLKKYLADRGIGQRIETKVARAADQ